MVTIQQTELKEGILKAIEKAKKSSTSILVSEVHKIDSITPLSFFARGTKNNIKERFFWKHPSEETYMIGLGICKRIESDQAADRFFHVEREWKRFIDEAIILDHEQIQGTGPTAFGGFSFDPLKEGTGLWSNFASSLFYIPRFMLSLFNGQAYLTTNIICSPQDDLSLLKRVEEEREQLLVQAEKQEAFHQALLIKQTEVKPAEWKQTVNKVVHDLAEGPLKKVVLARELRLLFDSEIQVEQVLSALLLEQKDSYVFSFESQGDCFIGASPERLVNKENDQVYSACLAGSMARGNTTVEDELLGKTLLNDDKNIIEHQYVVDMIKGAMEESCSEVTIPTEPLLLKLKNIQHLYTPVKGRVNPDTTLLSLVDKLHPTPALGGLPKNLAIEKIREVEALDRGLYGGPIGWFDYQGNGEFAVAIRSGLIQGEEASIFAGCGVVEDSIAEMEYQETNIKFTPMLSALGGIKS